MKSFSHSLQAELGHRFGDKTWELRSAHVAILCLECFTKLEFDQFDLNVCRCSFQNDLLRKGNLIFWANLHVSSLLCMLSFFSAKRPLVANVAVETGFVIDWQDAGRNQHFPHFKSSDCSVHVYAHAVPPLKPEVQRFEMFHYVAQKPQLTLPLFMSELCGVSPLAFPVLTNFLRQLETSVQRFPSAQPSHLSVTGLHVGNSSPPEVMEISDDSNLWLT